MCKHVAAVLYGIGARLDERPELLFNLRRVDERDLIAKAGSSLPLSKSGPASDKVLASSDLSALFGLDFAAVEAQALPAPRGGGTKAVSRRKGTAIEVTNRPPAASRKTKAKRKAAKR
jgi:uncharacterized Zn finger protein